jgi:myosin heavy subunit
LSDLGLQRRTSNYNYLQQGTSKSEAQDFNDAKNYNEMMKAFTLMGFDENETIGLLKVVSAVLHIGNISFDPIDDGEASIVSISADVTEATQSASLLLGVSPSNLCHALVSRTFTSGSMRKSITRVKLNTQRACDTRDSLARALYDKIFLEIIIRINFYSKSGPSSKCIGLLDIFGFEVCILHELLFLFYYIVII